MNLTEYRVGHRAQSMRGGMDLWTQSPINVWRNGTLWTQSPDTEPIQCGAEWTSMDTESRHRAQSMYSGMDLYGHRVQTQSPFNVGRNGPLWTQSPDTEPNQCGAEWTSIDTESRHRAQSMYGGMDLYGHRVQTQSPINVGRKWSV